MQAVADELGVDRKTVHYHVKDREELVLLVAQDVFTDELARVTVDPAADWREAIRSFAVAVRDASVAAGVNAALVQIDPDNDWEALAPAEAALRALLGAGFDELTSAQLLTTAGVLATGFARDLATERQAGPRAQRDAVKRALRAHSDGGLPALEHLVDNEAAIDAGNEASFQFALEIMVSGAEQILSRRGA
ncbi:hypothetical protein GCM10022382_15150 [Microbacterium invictum]|nr:MULTISPECIES: TetR/AcrR family transcriptional regulator C-terminal domain-containing protein [Microbacterium]